MEMRRVIVTNLNPAEFSHSTFLTEALALMAIMTRAKPLTPGFSLMIFMTLGLMGGAAAKADPTFPPTVTVENHSLVLNGMGTRKATIFKVKVYNAALYLEKRSSNSQAILDSTGFKRVDLSFLRNVDRGKISEAWQEGLDKNCGSDCTATKPQTAQLLSFMADMKEGDTMAFVFSPEHLEVWVKGQRAGAINGATFERIVLSTWLGPNPPNPELKEGMLGTATR
jgi:hypothetical protein